jgi:glycine/D-amino acid oxidase-like deaminating enzyme
MIGMSSGPASAKLVTQVITGEEPFMDMSLMDPSRFG